MIVAGLDFKGLEEAYVTAMSPIIFGWIQDNPKTVKWIMMTNPKDRVGIKKPPVHLVPAAGIIEMAMAMKNGALKYGPYNWRSHPVNLTVYIGAAQRHLLLALDGEDKASDSGCHHAAHVAACMAIILDAIATGNLIDDRPVKGSS